MGREIVGGVARGWLAPAALALVAALGLVLLVLGLREAAAQLVFGGVMLAVIAVAGVLQHLAERPGSEGEAPSLLEKASWQGVGVGLAAIMVLGGLSLGSTQGRFSAWLVFAAYVLIVVLHPLLRRRFVEANLRHCDIAEDERDRALRGHGDRTAKRVLELTLVAIAVAWVALPGVFALPAQPVRVASLLLLPVQLANVVGEARVAWLYWRDRQ